mmetsp:Transcript_36584/g.54543  ORF Transcript_36584/g.54543 Transcript_36584/m.54543 type:complete len:550 (-) Transcript_36584:133-1782(-)|eukprot:CAMPEP_0194037984 /NCGR_PEP_ID=MMETSP0009_2-20130614/10269_1 /TAXON_ID=210454 /ORGANISM="Grammatophora oceanica, Strain CCMP 410" /LENGTH=549 /DNA_ID=CAMNT_0038680337 /DNA_START=79 /DNA_END=1728 /DNA_ORIENTATION=+
MRLGIDSPPRFLSDDHMAPRLMNSSSSMSGSTTSTASSGRQKLPGDHSILRGASIVRNNILKGWVDDAPTKSSSRVTFFDDAAPVIPEPEEFQLFEDDEEDFMSDPEWHDQPNAFAEMKSKNVFKVNNEDEHSDVSLPDDLKHWSDLAFRASRKDSPSRRSKENSRWGFKPKSNDPPKPRKQQQKQQPVNSSAAFEWDSFVSGGAETLETNTSPLDWASFNSSPGSPDKSVPDLFAGIPPPVPDVESSPSSGSKSTHVTTMGREQALKFKIYEYSVERRDSFSDDVTYDSALSDDPEEQGVAPMPLPPPCFSGLSPMSAEYARLQREESYIHARNGGYLWQSLVGQHVRFPKAWWDGSRAPMMGCEEMEKPNGKRVPRYLWQYIARHRVRENRIFEHLVKNRGSPGRLMLHIIIKDLDTMVPMMDIAVGCFHPNARGIRTEEQPDPDEEETREVWMALRKRIELEFSSIETLLCRGKKVEDVGQDAPFGSRRNVTNANMRAVFGEEPPVHTIFIQESELYEKLQLAAELDPTSAQAPALMLLQEFLSLG